MPKLFSKLVISFLASLILFFGVVSPAMAQSSCSLTIESGTVGASIKLTDCSHNATYTITITGPNGEKWVTDQSIKTDNAGSYTFRPALPDPTAQFTVVIKDASGNVVLSGKSSTGSDTTGSGVGTAIFTGEPGPWYSQSFPQWYSKVYDTSNPQEIFGERYTAAQVQWVFYGLISQFISVFSQNNPDVRNCLLTIFNGNATTCGETVIKTMIKIQSDSGKDRNFFAALFEDRPLSAVNYIRNIGQKLNIIPEAKAQGVGFGYTAFTFGGGLSEIQRLWSIIRNLSYAIFVIVIVAIAFMIMFRVKISPQVVISIQSALPRIILGLILVTFSWAIAGFLIDIMYVVIGIISLIFSQFAVAGISFNNIFQQGNSLIGYFDLLTKGPLFGIAHTGIFGLLVIYIVNYIIAFLDIALSGIAHLFISPGQAALGVVTFILGLIGLIVVVIVAIINFFKIIFLLAKTFLILMFLTIFAPLQFTLAVVVPGIGIGAWIKSYATKLAVFVGVGVMSILSLWILQMAVDISHGIDANKFPQGWPPLLGSTPQMLALGFLIASIAIFVMIPKVADMIESFASGKPFAMGTAIGEAMAVPSGLAGLLATERIQRAQNVNKDQTAWQNVRALPPGAARNRATVEYLLSELTRRLAGGR